MDFDIKPARRVATAPYTFHRLSPDAANPIRLHCKQLGPSNEAYANAAFDRKPDLAERKGFDAMAHDRDLDLADIAAYCVSSWDNVLQAGKPAECTPEKVLAFLKHALANGYDEEVNGLRVFVKFASNFRESVSAEDLGKG